jgi:hypothetical protein
MNTLNSVSNKSGAKQKHTRETLDALEIAFRRLQAYR